MLPRLQNAAVEELLQCLHQSFVRATEGALTLSAEDSLIAALFIHEHVFDYCRGLLQMAGLERLARLPGFLLRFCAASYKLPASPIIGTDIHSLLAPDELKQFLKRVPCGCNEARGAMMLNIKRAHCADPARW